METCVFKFKLYCQVHKYDVKHLRGTICVQNWQCILIGLILLILYKKMTLLCSIVSLNLEVLLVLKIIFLT